MRFKARLEAVKSLVEIANCINTLACKCALKMTNTMWTFMVPNFPSSEYTEDITLEFNLEIHAMFVNYRLESKSSDGIFLIITDVPAFLQCVKSAHSVSHTTVKLSKHHGITVLMFIMEENGCQTMTANVPVDVKKLNDWQAEGYEPPNIPPPNVRIRCPPLKMFRSGLLRMTSVTNTLNMRLAGDAGDGANLVCAVKTHAVEVDCYFQNLSINSESNDEEVSVVIKLNKLLKAINALTHLQMENASLCVSKTYACMIHAKLAHGMGHATLYVSLTADDS